MSFKAPVATASTPAVRAHANNVNGKPLLCGPQGRGGFSTASARSGDLLRSRPVVFARDGYYERALTISLLMFTKLTSLVVGVIATTNVVVIVVLGIWASANL